MNRNVPLVGVDLNKVTPLSRGLVGWWPTICATSKRVRDVTGNQNAAILTSTNPSAAQWQGGGLNCPNAGALKLDGTNDWAIAPHQVQLAQIGDITISCWVNPTNFTTADKYILSKMSGGFAAPYRFSLTLTTGLPSLARGNGAAQTAVAGTAAPTAGAWTHIAVTQLGTAVTHYLNGQPNGTGALSQATTDSGTALYIGQGLAGALQFIGGLSNIRLYNRALSQTEIQQLKNEPYTGFQFQPFATTWKQPRGGPFMRKRSM